MSPEGGQSDHNCSDWPRAGTKNTGTVPLAWGLSHQAQTVRKLDSTIGQDGSGYWDDL